MAPAAMVVHRGGVVLLYSLALLVVGPAVMGQDDSSLLEDKRNVATLARSGNLPFLRQEIKKFVHPLQWQNNVRMQDALDKRFSHPVAAALQSGGSRALEEALEKRFAHPVASAWQSGGVRELQEALDKRFAHPVASAWQSGGARAIQEALDKRFAHPVASAWQSGGVRELQDALEKRFSHPVTSSYQNHQKVVTEELEKRFSHPVQSAWQNGGLRALEEALEKRYVGSLARARPAGKRGSELDDALVQELVNEILEKQEEEEVENELTKRNVGALARAGVLGSSGKRSANEMTPEEQLADALLLELVNEYLEKQRREETELEEDVDNSLNKRYVASIARTGVLPAGKRNIAAMARDGYLTQHRPNQQDQDAPVEGEASEDGDDAIESVIEEVDKRHLGALARGFNMPLGLTSGGKRNVGALARSGLLARLSGKRYELDEEKRNIASLLRGRLNGKRSLLRGQYLPFAYARLSGIRDSFIDPGKRNIQSLLKSWRPIDQYSNGHGKRYNLYFNNELPSTRRYVAALMNSPARVLGQQQQNDEQKRHLGSLLGTSGKNNKGFTVQKKSSATGSNGSSGPARSKRQVSGDDSVLSVEYPMPVLQGSDFYDFEEDSPAVTEEKRFLGRIPHMGRAGNKGRTTNNGGSSRRRQQRGFGGGLRSLLAP